MNIPSEEFHVASIQLLCQLKGGDATAFTKLYEAHVPALYTNLLRMVHCENTAREILQESFLKVWHCREQLDPEKPFGGFLFKIATNLAYDYFRRVARDKRLIHTLMEAASGSCTTSDDLPEYKESCLPVNRAIAQLPAQRRQVFTLCRIEGKTYKEVSHQLGITVATISDHIVKANKAIKAYLQQHKNVVTFLLHCLSPLFYWYFLKKY